MNLETTTEHGSCVAFGNHGVLIIGATGAGKSGLAMQLISLGGVLVADDQVILQQRGGRIIAKCPKTLRGMIEARGLGLLAVQSQPQTDIVCVIDMDKPEPARLPPDRMHTLLGIEVDLVLGKDTPNLACALYLRMQGARIA
ncbi:MAG: HPr kinase/phosphatase C-terminal domain-containing protein [Paracoccaceae bacterium]